MNKISVLLVVLLFSFSSLALSIKSLGLVGDAGVRHPLIQKLRTSLIDHGVDNIVLLGDNIYDLNLSYSDIWSPWIADGFKFQAVAIGNHLKSIEEEVSYFNMPGDFYSITFQSARFIVLNSENTANIDQQMDFLENLLSRKRLEKQIYLIVHHPYVTVSDFHSWTERPEFQKKLRPLILKYSDKLTAVLSGHDHLANFVDINGLPLIVSGASFESRPTRKLNYQDQSFKVQERWQYKGGKYWTRLDISEDASAAWIHFIPFDGAQEECRFRIYPRPYKMINNCKTSKGKKVH